MATTPYPTQSAALPVGAALPSSDRIGQNGLTPIASNGVGAAHTSVSQADAGTGLSSLIAAGHAAVGSPDGVGADEDVLRLSPSCARMPVGLVVSVPVRDFRVRNLLAMASGTVIETQWGYGEDLPLSSGDVQLAWSEFEVVDTRLAVRVTRLA